MPGETILSLKILVITDNKKVKNGKIELWANSILLFRVVKTKNIFKIFDLL